MNGIELIAKERARQVTVEGWSAEHDKEHSKGELLIAALCYAKPGVTSQTPMPDKWPFEVKWWKPSDDPTMNLTKAGALIAAEIDRLRHY